MAKNFKLLQAKMSPEARARSHAKAERIIAAMTLDELRTARDLTQASLAKRLRVKQPAISKLERQADMYVSTLHDMIEGMGGTLEIRALFPGGPVVIDQFSKLRHLPPARLRNLAGSSRRAVSLPSRPSVRVNGKKMVAD